MDKRPEGKAVTDTFDRDKSNPERPEFRSYGKAPQVENTLPVPDVDPKTGRKIDDISADDNDE